MTVPTILSLLSFSFGLGVGNGVHDFSLSYSYPTLVLSLLTYFLSASLDYLVSTSMYLLSCPSQ